MRNTIKNRFLIGLGVIGCFIFFGIISVAIFSSSDRSDAMELDETSLRKIYLAQNVIQEMGERDYRLEEEKKVIHKAVGDYNRSILESITELESLGVDVSIFGDDVIWSTVFTKIPEEEVFTQPSPQEAEMKGPTELKELNEQAILDRLE